MASQASNAVSAYLTGPPSILPEKEDHGTQRSLSPHTNWSLILLETAKVAQQEGEDQLSAELIELAQRHGA